MRSLVVQVLVRGQGSKNADVTMLQGSKKEVISEVRVTLHHGDICVMLPPSQEEWHHEIPQMKMQYPYNYYRGRTDRLNYTFRMDRDHDQDDVAFDGQVNWSQSTAWARMARLQLRG